MSIEPHSAAKAMSTLRSRDMYVDRMHRVMEHIDQNLDQFLDLETLAEVAHFSPFHFHRLFSAWMGETLGGYLRRRRCEIAATRLAAQPRLGILDIALGVGFGSAEAFTHAFSSRFGSSPTAWRLQQSASRMKSNSDQANSKPDQPQDENSVKDGAANCPTPEAPMKVEIIGRKPATIAYLQLDSRPMFEYYPTGSSYDPATGVLDCKLCVPVIPL